MPSQSRSNQVTEDLALSTFPDARTPWGMLSQHIGFTGWPITSVPMLTENESSIATYLTTKTFSLTELMTLPILAPISLNEIQFFQELRNAISLAIATEISAGMFSINGDLLVRKFNEGTYGTWRWDTTGPFNFSVGTKEELLEIFAEDLMEMGIEIEQWGIGKQEALRLAEVDIQDSLACGVAKIDRVVDGDNVYILNLDVAQVAHVTGLIGRWKWLADWKQPEQQEEAAENEEQKTVDKAKIAEYVEDSILKVSGISLSED